MAVQVHGPNLNNGACDGMRFDDKLKFLPGKPQPKCLLASGKRCDHFEECVMPMAGIVSDPAKSKSYLEAVAEYLDVDCLACRSFLAGLTQPVVAAGDRRAQRAPGLCCSSQRA